MPPVPTATVYASVAAVVVALLTVPVRNPFSSTVPFGSATVAGPLAAVPLWLSTHVMTADCPCTLTLVFHVPSTVITVGDGLVPLVLLSLQPATVMRLSTKRTKARLMMSTHAKFMPMERALSGRVAIVTGSTRGIGTAIAKALADAGADVVLHGRRPSSHADAAQRAAAAAGTRVTMLFADLSQRGETERLIREATAAAGPIDILVNNAAIARAVPIEQLTLADWDEHVATNLTPVFVAIQAVLPGMRARRWGRIISISSTAAQARTVIGPHYAATKAGILGMTRVYAGMVAADGVTVNAIAPALIETDMIAGTTARPDMLPVGRFGRPEEVAAAALLLATNGYMTGQTVNVNGGLYMG